MTLFKIGVNHQSYFALIAMMINVFLVKVPQNESCGRKHENYVVLFTGSLFYSLYVIWHTNFNVQESVIGQKDGIKDQNFRSCFSPTFYLFFSENGPTQPNRIYVFELSRIRAFLSESFIVFTLNL